MGEKDLKKGDKRRDLQQPTVKSHLFNITPLLLDRLGVIQRLLWGFLRQPRNTVPQGHSVSNTQYKWSNIA